MSELLIASGNGQVYKYNSQSTKIKSVFTNPNANEWFMGLTKYKDKIVVGSTFGLHVFKWQKEKLYCLSSMVNIKVMNPRFKHIRTVGNLIFATSITSNAIFIIRIEENNKLVVVGRVIIKRTGEITHFDQICDIVFSENRFYALLHRLADNPTESRLLVFSNSFKLLKYYEFGWNAHGLAITPEHRYVLCNHTKKTSIGGLVLDTDIKFAWGPDYKMKDIAITTDSIFIVGHAIVEKSDTTLNGGIVLELGHDFKVKNMQMFCGHGQFLGCMVIDEEDLSNNTDQLSADVIDLYNQKEENIEVKLIEDKTNDTISQSKD